RPGQHRRGDGRRRHRDRPVQHRRGDRGGAVLRAAHRPHLAQAPALLGVLAQVRARRRLRAAARSGLPRHRPPRRAGRRPGRAGRHAHRRGGAAGADPDRRRAAPPHRWAGLPAGGGGAPAGGGRLHGAGRRRRAGARPAALLGALGGGRFGPGGTHLGAGAPPAPIRIGAGLPGRIAGLDCPRETVVRRLEEVGCTVRADGDALEVAPPTWRPDLTDPNDLAEEVIRLEGYANIPSVPPRAPAGRGLTPTQRRRRAVGRALAAAGHTEVLNYPFTGERDLDALQLEGDDLRRSSVRLANPLNDDEPLLRTTLLPGLLKTLVRNTGRGFGDVALFEMGRVYLPVPGAPERAPLPGVDRAPSAEERAAIDAALPHQPMRAGAVLAG